MLNDHGKNVLPGAMGLSVFRNMVEHMIVHIRKFRSCYSPQIG